MFDLYDSSYGNYGSEAYRQVRLETYGRDFGQTSWVTTEESQEIPRLLGLQSGSSVLEIGCGSGGYALHLAEKTGCRIVGLTSTSPGFAARRNSQRPPVLLHERALNNATFQKNFLLTTKHLTPPFPTMFCAIFPEDSTCCSRSFEY